MKKTGEMKRTAIALMAAAALSMTVSADAALTSVKEYDQKNAEQQAETVRAALRRIYENFAKKDAAIANCMVNIFKPVTNDTDNISKGYIILVGELDHTRKQPPKQRRSVERIIYDIVKSECVPAAKGPDGN